MTQSDLFGEFDRINTAFFNTISLKGTELAQVKRSAQTQEDAVLAFFRARPGHLITPEDALKALGARPPITSVRRAITNLVSQGKLIKTERMRKGQWGKPIHYWMLASQNAYVSACEV